MTTAAIPRYTYYPGGHIASVTYPDGQTVTYQDDTMGRVIQVSVRQPNGNTTMLADAFSYNAFAGPSAFTFGNGRHFTETLNQDNLPASMGSGPWSKTYSYNPANDVNTLTDTASGKQQSFQYDAMERLTGAVNSATGSYGSLAYAYDTNGNRTSTIDNGSTISVVYTPTGSDYRLRDADGNTVYGTTLGTLSYDGYVRLVKAADAVYAYNALGERVLKQTRQTATTFSYGPGRQLMSETKNGHTEDYVWLDGVPLARLDSRGYGAGNSGSAQSQHADQHERNSNPIYYFHTDALGTPQAMTDSAGRVVWAANYTPFGQATLTVRTITNNLRMPGQYYDQETGLAYNDHRDYDATIGRYVEADPIGLAGGMNVYAYVEGNPVSLIDPFGLAWQLTASFGGGIIVPGLGFTAYTNWGINFDWLNTSGYIQDQVNYGLGAGYYAGWGLGVGGGHGDPVTTDVGTTPGYVEGDAGGGPYSGGASATLNNCGTPTAISGAVGAKVGAAAGAGAFVGSSWSSSISSPTIQDFINFIGSWF